MPPNPRQTLPPLNIIPASAPAFKDHHHQQQPHSLTKKLLPWTLYTLLPIALLRLYFYPSPLSPPQSPTDQQHLSHSFFTSSPPPLQEKKREGEIQCDYTNGKWVKEKVGPLYNGTSCSTIKEGQNCISHGRSDMGYLHYRWKPNQCHLPRFQPNTFLQFLRNKHLAFVGDSLARNQLESLLCLLSTVSSPVLIYTNGDDNKFRTWRFDSHNATVSIYWSPFLVRGVEKSTGFDYNRLYMDSVDDRWAKDLNRIDMIVFSIGHWFLHPAVYFEGDNDDVVLGCHYCPGLNYTEVGFYDVFGKAFNTTLKTLIKNRASEIGVIVTTFSPAHFEGDWDKLDACSKIKPYEEGEKVLEGMDLEMRRIEVAEVEAARKNGGLRVEVLDVSGLSLMRPDGHPGPYMNPYPFANGVSDRVQNDCVHWCLPGPIDTWNEILLEVMKKWEGQSKR